MSKGKSSLSKARSYKEIGEFCDTHELTDFWDKTKEAEFEVDIESEITYYALDKNGKVTILLCAEGKYK